MTKHIIQEGSRQHIVYWNKDGTHCTEKECEINLRHNATYPESHKEETK